MYQPLHKICFKKPVDRQTNCLFSPIFGPPTTGTSLIKEEQCQFCVMTCSSLGLDSSFRTICVRVHLCSHSTVKILLKFCPRDSRHMLLCFFIHINKQNKCTENQTLPQVQDHSISLCVGEFDFLYIHFA